MKGSIRDLHRYLASAIVGTKMARNIVQFLSDRKALLSQDEVHAIQDAILMLSSDVATMEVLMSEYARMGSASKNFVSVSKEVVQIEK
jgi:hypothetical protein